MTMATMERTKRREVSRRVPVVSGGRWICGCRTDSPQGDLLRGPRKTERSKKQFFLRERERENE